MKKSTDSNQELKQVAVLVGVDLPLRFGNMLGGESDLSELALLAKTAGAKVVGQVHQSRQKPDAAIFIGKGKKTRKVIIKLKSFEKKSIKFI